MGMETLVFFRISGLDVCARVSPNAGAREGARHAARRRASTTCT